MEKKTRSIFIFVQRKQFRCMWACVIEWRGSSLRDIANTCIHLDACVISLWLTARQAAMTRPLAPFWWSKNCVSSNLTGAAVLPNAIMCVCMCACVTVTTCQNHYMGNGCVRVEKTKKKYHERFFFSSIAICFFPILSSRVRTTTRGLTKPKMCY